MGDAARRHRQPDIDGLDRAVDAIKAKPQCARADIVAHQHMDEVLHQPAGAGDDRLLGDDRLEQIMQAVIDRRRDDRDERLVDAAERLIETAQEFGGKTRGERRARLVHQRADGFEAEPAQRRAGFRLTAARRRWADPPAPRLPGPRAERTEALGESATAPRPCRACRPPQAVPADRNAQALRQDRRSVSPRRRTDALSLRCRGKNRRRRCLSSPRRSGRRVARRPQRQPAQRGIVGGGIDGAHLQKTRFRPRVGQRLADRQAPPPPPPRSRRRCAGRRRRQRQGRTAGQDRPACRICWLVCGIDRLRREKALDRPARQPN